MSSTSTVIGRVSPISGHFTTGTRGSWMVTSEVGSPGATTTAWIVARPYTEVVPGGGEIPLTSAVPATQARAPRRTTLTMPRAMDSASTAKPKITTPQLDMPSPRAITKIAMVPMTAATSLRAGAMGRPVCVANVDLPLVTGQVIARPHRSESAVVPALARARIPVPIG
jgi:hypothetical protein